MIKALQALDFEVYCCPEVPTILINGGCSYPGLADDKRKELLEFEINLMRLQMQLEDRLLLYINSFAHLIIHLLTHSVTSISLHRRIRKLASFSIGGVSISLLMYHRHYLTRL